MDRILVQSSNLVSVGYDAAGQLLEVEFLTGKTYRYHQVPRDVYQGLMSAPSKGEYLHDNILNRYEFQEV
jgi:YD repeat-containing protein